MSTMPTFFHVTIQGLTDVEGYELLTPFDQDRNPYLVAAKADGTLIFEVTTYLPRVDLLNTLLASSYDFTITIEEV